MSARVAVAALVCDGTTLPKVRLDGGLAILVEPAQPCPVVCEASAPLLGDDAIDLEQATRRARRNAVALAESLGWAVSPSGKPVRDLCPACAAKAVKS
jgi:hypothetical protein